MQKDVHFYLTYVLAKRAGLPTQDAEKLAWDGWFADGLTELAVRELGTESAGGSSRSDVRGEGCLRTRR